MTAPAAKSAVLASLVATVLGAAPLARAAESDLAVLDRLEKELEGDRKKLQVVRDLVERGELSSLERAKQRFSEAETQFLLENYEGCAALLLDALDAPEFQKEPGGIL